MIKSILKGMVIGIANIIPGVSGGTMMVSMGIYDKAIHCITHLFSEFKKSILFLLPIFIGMGIAIVGSSFGLEYLFAQFPVQTSLLFIGLVLGGLPIIIKSVKKENAAGKKTNAGHIIIGLLFFAVVAGMALLGEKEGAAANMSFTLINVLKLFGVGHSRFRYYGSTRRQRLHDASFDGILQSDSGDYHRLFQKSGGL